MFSWDFFHDLELPTKEFAQGLRQICDETGAVLVLDDVRSSFRLGVHGSWTELVGVEPDLAAYCKGIANGYPLAAVLGRNACRGGVRDDSLFKSCRRVGTTGSFWCNSVPMAAAIATIKVLQEDDAIGQTVRAGRV
jgi:glutamate-1-semialdehyde 2,1-aminomutase